MNHRIYTNDLFWIQNGDFRRSDKFVSLCKHILIVYNNIANVRMNGVVLF